MPDASLLTFTALAVMWVAYFTLRGWLWLRRREAAQEAAAERYFAGFRTPMWQPLEDQPVHPSMYRSPVDNPVDNVGTNNPRSRTHETPGSRTGETQTKPN